MRAWLFLVAVMMTAAVQSAFAITDEIQVYTDELNEPGERGLELHLNTTPRGRKTPDYAGDLPPYRGTRITPEFSLGLGHALEAGLYLPTAFDANGDLYGGGLKLRLKWLPVHGSDEQGGWYFGANQELSNLTKKFSDSHLSTELRVIGGYRDKEWLIGVNPVLGWGLSPGFRGSPEATMAVKAVHKVASGISMGGEYYNTVGTLAHHLPGEQQDRSLFLVMDFDRKPWVFNVGVGHGLTPASDNWTLKAILEIPFH
jgi:hypothetical protein